jgi:hypothetical protein
MKECLCHDNVASPETPRAFGTTAGGAPVLFLHKQAAESQNQKRRSETQARAYNM